MIKSIAVLALSFLSLGSIAQSTQTRTIGSFHSIQVNGSMNVVLTEGSSKEVKLEGDAAVLNEMEVLTDDGKLTIGWKSKNYRMPRSVGKLTVYVQTTRLDNVLLNGSGNLSATGRFTTDKDFNVMTNGSGNINIETVNTQNLNVAINGSGNCTISGGKAKEVNASVRGSGNLSASEVVSSEANVMIQGSGNASVQATGELNAMVQGSGMVRYKGNPRIETTSKNKVQKI